MSAASEQAVAVLCSDDARLAFARAAAQNTPPAMLTEALFALAAIAAAPPRAARSPVAAFVVSPPAAVAFQCRCYARR